MKYKAMIIDPPWEYRNRNLEGAAEKEYSTLGIEALRALPVGELADEDCVLFLWCTWPLMREGLELIDAWGFQYVTGMPWVKIGAIVEVANAEIEQTATQRSFTGDVTLTVPYGIGFWVRGATEFVLIARRGNVVPPRADGFVGLLSRNLKHSRKPDSLHRYVEAMPGPYLEIFARRPMPGWDTWGNDIDGRDIREVLKVATQKETVDFRDE